MVISEGKVAFSRIWRSGGAAPVADADIRHGEVTASGLGQTRLACWMVQCAAVGADIHHGEVIASGRVILLSA